MNINNSLNNSSGMKRRLDASLEDLPCQIKFPYLPNEHITSSPSSSTPSSASSTPSPTNFPSIQQQLKAFSNHSIESLPTHNDYLIFSQHSHNHHHHSHHNHNHNQINNGVKPRTSPISDVLHNLPCNQVDSSCDCKSSHRSSLLPSSSGEFEREDLTAGEDDYDADDENEQHSSGFISPRGITPSTTPLNMSGGISNNHHKSNSSAMSTPSSASGQCSANDHHHHNKQPKISKEMDSHIKLLTSLGTENPSCPNCNIPATRRHDKRRWWCKNCTKSFTPFRKGKKLDANGEFIGNTAPQCGRCFQQATRKHDKRRWWCKVCKKPFTPSQFNLGDNSHIIFVMGSNKSSDEKPPHGNSNIDYDLPHNHHHLHHDDEPTHKPTNSNNNNNNNKSCNNFNSKIELLLNPVSSNQDKSNSSSLQSSTSSTSSLTHTIVPDILHKQDNNENDMKKFKSKYGEHHLLEEDIMTLNTLQNIHQFFKENKNPNSQSILNDITPTKPKSTSPNHTYSTSPVPTLPSNSCTATPLQSHQQPSPPRPKYNSLKLTNNYDIIDSEEVVKQSLRNHHPLHHINDLSPKSGSTSSSSSSGNSFEHRRISPTSSLVLPNPSVSSSNSSSSSLSNSSSSSSKNVKTPSEMILDNSFEALVQLNGLEKSQQIIYDWLEKSQYTFLFEKILHPEVYKQLMLAKTQN